MTTQLQSRPSTMVFKQTFGFKPGLRVTGAGRGRGRAASSEGAGYCSLPCTTGLDSLKSEADTHRGEVNNNEVKYLLSILYSCCSCCSRVAADDHESRRGEGGGRGHQQQQVRYTACSRTTCRYRTYCRTYCRGVQHAALARLCHAGC